ncbi:MAG: DUF3088 family protein [Steroidobacteraceae bacterium]
MTKKDQLYLLRPGFRNAGVGPLYCNDSVPVEGMLSFFPALRTLVDVQYLDFPRPRRALVEALGEQHQALPVLILAPDRVVRDAAPEPQRNGDKRFYANERHIRDYLSAQYDIAEAS